MLPKYFTFQGREERRIDNPASSLTWMFPQQSRHALDNTDAVQILPINKTGKQID
jgi:hypothetical protein